MTRVWIFCLLMFSATFSSAQPRAGLSAREILDKTVSVYASCSSYADTGEVKDVFLKTQRQVLRPFSTAFVRPSQFRFEFEDNNGLRSDYVVWQSGPSVRNWWSVKPEIRSFETLALALASATGVSGGSAVQVPSMLFGDLHDSHLIQTLSELVLTGEEKIGERPAYKIKGMAGQDHEMTIWIDEESFLLLKTLEIRQLVNSGEVEKTTTYKPEINTRLSADKLAFKH